MADTIMQNQQRIANEGVITLFKVGWDNRETMGQEIADLVEEMISK